MPGRRLIRQANLLSAAELWLDGGVLISVFSRRIQENYQRFALDQIQALTLTHRPFWTAGQTIGLACAIGFALLPLLSASIYARLGWSIITIWPLVFMGIHLARGPRCKVIIHMAAGAHALPALTRVRRAEGVVAELTGLIEGAQGRLESITLDAPPPEDQHARQLREHAKLAPLRMALGITLALGAVLGFLELWRPRDNSLFGVEVLQAVAELILASVLWERTPPLLRSSAAGRVSAIALGLIVLWVFARGISAAAIDRDLALRALTGAGVLWRLAIIGWGLLVAHPPEAES